MIWTVCDKNDKKHSSTVVLTKRVSLLFYPTTSITEMMTESSRTLPEKFFDGHHHYVDTQNHATTFHQFLSQFLPDTMYLPEDYHKDVVVPLQEAGIGFVGSIHMEAIPSDGLGEAQWVSEFMDEGKDDSSSKFCPVKGIVASCHLAAGSEDQVKSELQKLTDPTNFSSSSSSISSSPVKGIRWILDCVGKFNGQDATHIATKRHNGIDYLRSGGGSSGDNEGDKTNQAIRYDGSVVPEFERGFALLGSRGLTFDLQCAPVQLSNAAKLCLKYPNSKVVIDHMGKPRMLLGPDLILSDKDAFKNDDDTATTTSSSLTNINPNLQVDQDELQVWRDGMKEMSKCPNVYCKISMLGYIIPGWNRTQQRKDVMKSLVLETVGKVLSCVQPSPRFWTANNCSYQFSNVYRLIAARGIFCTDQRCDYLSIVFPNLHISIF